MAQNARQAMSNGPTLNEDADDLPFGPVKRQKQKWGHILTTDVVKELKAVNADIWNVGKLDAGLLLHCMIHRKQVRVLIPSKSVATLPEEKNSAVHIVVTLGKLRTWLHTLSA